MDIITFLQTFGIFGLCNSTLLIFIKKYIDKKEQEAKEEKEKKENEQKDLLIVKDAISYILYKMLSDYLNEVINKEEISSAERKIIFEMYGVYKKMGFNGDMDARLDIINDLPIRRN